MLSTFYVLFEFCCKHFQNLLVNSLSLLMINFFNSSWLLINSCSIMYINTDAVAVFLNEINIMYLINLFTIIQYAVKSYFHAEFFDDDNFIMKFIVTDFHDLFNTSIYVTSSYCLFLWILFLQHESHLVMYFMIQFLKSLTLHLLHEILNSFNFKMFINSVVVTFSYQLSFIKEAFFTLYVAAKSFVRISLFSLRISVWTHFTFSWSVIYSKCLLHHSHYFSCNEFEIQSLLTTQFSESVTDSAFCCCEVSQILMINKDLYRLFDFVR
jgi:hypothetical protein